MTGTFASMLGIAAPLLSGCAPKADPDPVYGEFSDAKCNANNVQSFLGQILSDKLADQMKSRSGASLLRIAHRDGVITMDYNANRLNIFHDDAKVIVRVNCG